MAAGVVQFSHNDIDPGSIQAPSFGHNDIDPNSIQLANGTQPESSWLDKKLPLNTSPRGIIQGGLNALPAVGGVAGGVAGVETGPGALATAGLGYAGGEALKNLGEHYILGQEKTRADIYGKPAMGLVKGAEQEMGGQLAGAAIKTGGKFVGKALEHYSEVPEEAINTYAGDPSAVKQLASESGNDIPEAADLIRSKYADAIKSKKAELNSSIDNAIAKSQSANELVDGSPIIKALENSKAGLNPKLNGDEIGQIDGVISKIQSLGNKDPYKLGTSDNLMTAQDLNQAKKYLQGIGESAYEKNGQMFNYAEATARAAKSGAAEARGLLNEAVPEVADANNQLSNLHDIEDVMQKNLISEGKPEAGLISAGTGKSLRNAKNLENLGDATGTDMLTPAKQLAAQRYLLSNNMSPAGTKATALRYGLDALGLARKTDLGTLSSEAGQPYTEGLISPMVTSKGLISPMLPSGDAAANAIGKTADATAAAIEKRKKDQDLKASNQ